MTTQEKEVVPVKERWTDWLGKRAPNFLTLFRIFIVPVFVVLLFDPTPLRCIWAAGLFIFASVTDWLDGYLARVYRAESKLGTLLDPLADKILVMAALVMLCAIPAVPRVPAWIVVALLAREFIVSGLRSIAGVQGIVVPASTWAKHKTAWTMVGISFLLIREPYIIFGVLIDFHFSGMVFLCIGLVLSVITGVAYAVSLRKVVM